MQKKLSRYITQQKIYPYHQDQWYHSDLSWYVSDCTVTCQSKEKNALITFLSHNKVFNSEQNL
jgi:hypothetical protein